MWLDMRSLIFREDLGEEHLRHNRDPAWGTPKPHGVLVLVYKKLYSYYSTSPGRLGHSGRAGRFIPRYTLTPRPAHCTRRFIKQSSDTTC